MTDSSISPKNEEFCPCGSSEPYRSCCGPFHCGERYPETAEALMRSRYAAYVKSQVEYLWITTHPNQRSPQLRNRLQEACKQTIWLGLEIIEVTMGDTNNKIGKVKFIATYREGTEIHQLRELSRFKRYQGKWHYSGI
jgi:SEC-C motif domain protein